jgi:uncharacterized membrane protein
MTDKPPDSGYPKQKPFQAQQVPIEPTKPMPAQPAPYPPPQQQQPPQPPNQYPPQYWPEGQPPFDQNYDPRYQQPPYQQYNDQQYQQPYDPRYQQPYPPPYQQPPYQQGSRQGLDLGNINLNLDPPVAAALSYLFFIFSGIGMLVVEKKDQFVRFHAVQSILFTLSWVVIYFVWTIFYLILSLITAVLGFPGPLRAIGLVVNLLYLFFFGVWIALMVRAYRGERWKLPVIGDIAEKQLTDPIVK